jgi:hypothetical protein
VDATRGIRHRESRRHRRVGPSAATTAAIELRDEGTTILLVDQMRSASADELERDSALEAAYLGHAEAAQ